MIIIMGWRQIGHGKSSTVIYLNNTNVTNPNPNWQWLRQQMVPPYMYIYTVDI